jgi:hypothetical protein
MPAVEPALRSKLLISVGEGGDCQSGIYAYFRTFQGYARVVPFV